MAAPARATMDFFAAQAAARRRTALLVVYFALAVAGTAAAIWLGLSVIAAVQPDLGVAPFGVELAALVAMAVGTTTAAGAAWHAARLADGGHAVARMLGGVPVDRRAEDPGERRLVNVAEEMSIAAGLPVPALYVLPGEGGINAFAAGLAPDQAVVAVTRGALERLTRDELQGVVAHEYSHVLNGDARLNVRLLSVIGGITAVAAIGRLLVRLGNGSGTERSRWRTSSSKRSGGGVFLAAGLVFWVAGSVGAFFGRVIRAAVSRQREHLADAAAVQFTRNPDGLAGALAKIAHAGSRLGSAFAPEAAHLFFADGLEAHWLATHPPIKERIDRLLPNGYLRVMRLAAEPPRAPGEPAPPTPEEVGVRLAAAAAQQEASAPAGPLTAAALVASAGRLDARRVAHAAGLLRALPPEVAAAAREPAGAAALVRALLAGGPPQVRAAALAPLEPTLRARVEALAAALEPASREVRSAVLDLALPALDALGADAADALDADLSALAGADGQTTVFEWALLRIVRRRRARRLAPRRPARLRLEDVQPELLDVLSIMAWAGTAQEAGAQAAIDAALPVLGIPVGWRVLPRNRVSAQRLDAALDRLDEAIPPLKARLVEACAAEVLFDGRALPSELELLRAVAASIGVPVPPIVGDPPLAAAGVA